nr:MAG TPA: hypothetical protein [Caudoviricetes sp.]
MNAFYKYMFTDEQKLQIKSPKSKNKMLKPSFFHKRKALKSENELF